MKGQNCYEMTFIPDMSHICIMNHKRKKKRILRPTYIGHSFNGLSNESYLHMTDFIVDNGNKFDVTCVLRVLQPLTSVSQALTS